MKEIKFARAVVFINSLVPLALLAWDAYHHRLGANPLEFVTHTTGTLALVFLLISLAVTPLRRLLGLPWLIRLRRMLGLYAFFYASLHLITYFWFDKFFNMRAAVADIVKRPFIAVGMLAFFLLVPLAVTSTNNMIKQMGGRRWSLLHKSVYVAAALGVLHYYLLVKADTRPPLWFGAVLGVLLLFRLFAAYLPINLKMSKKPTADNPSSDL